MGLSTCPDCGATVRVVTVGDERIPLDERATVDGNYRLVSDDPERAERGVSQGFSGYSDHRETCWRKPERRHP